MPCVRTLICNSWRTATLNKKERRAILLTFHTLISKVLLILLFVRFSLSSYKEPRVFVILICERTWELGGCCLALLAMISLDSHQLVNIYMQLQLGKIGPRYNQEAFVISVKAQQHLELVEHLFETISTSPISFWYFRCLYHMWSIVAPAQCTRVSSQQTEQWSAGSQSRFGDSCLS